jgi:hypothetical protein
MSPELLTAAASFGGPFAGFLAVWRWAIKPMLEQHQSERREWMAKIQENTDATKVLTEHIKGQVCLYAIQHGLADEHSVKRLREARR